MTRDADSRPHAACLAGFHGEGGPECQPDTPTPQIHAPERPACSARLCDVCHEPAHTPGEECDAGDECPTRRVHLGRACRKCHDRMARQLREIPEEYALALGELTPTSAGGSGRSSEPSIGLRVSALDLRAGADVLAILGSWERDWRETFEDPAHTVAPRARASRGDRGDRVGANLVAVCGWLGANLIRSARAHPAIDEFAHELAVLHQEARSAARTAGRRETWVDCPTDTDTGVCATPLRLTGLDLSRSVYCRGCRREWGVQRLMLVAAADTEAGVWLLSEDVSVLLGVPERTLREWARKGRIERRGGQYELGSVKAAIAANTTRRASGC